MKEWKGSRKPARKKSLYKAILPGSPEVTLSFGPEVEIWMDLVYITKAKGVRLGHHRDGTRRTYQV